MSDEARAMLDALMGSDRNATLPSGASMSHISPRGNGKWNTSRRKKKSCYDSDICPLYCAWGVDVYDLFINTKSDLGPNPYIVQEDARAEFLSLPNHEKDRLGYEQMLYRKLSDLVRACDRVVSRNREKLRVELVKTARSKGSSGGIDPVKSINNDMLIDAANVIAEVEIIEDDIRKMISRLEEVEKDERSLWIKVKASNSALSEETQDKYTSNLLTGIESKYASEKKLNAENVPIQGSDEHIDKSNIKLQQKEGVLIEEKSSVGSLQPLITSINEKSMLYSLFSEKQKIMSSITLLTTFKIVPLRESIQNLLKQLYFVRNDTTADKTVCDTSGNFMSSRDADERIAAHYAGKQYVGWKMVRDKYKELHKKYRDFRGPPPIRSLGGLVNIHSSQSHRGFGRGYPPPCRDYRGRGYPSGRYDKDRRDRSSHDLHALGYVEHGFERRSHKPRPRFNDNFKEIDGYGNNGPRRRIGSPSDVTGCQGNSGYRCKDSGYYRDVTR